MSKYLVFFSQLPFNKSQPVRKLRSSLFGVSQVSNSRIFRLTCLAGSIFIIAGLFWLGTKPFAVGLFPVPLDKVAHFVTFGLITAMLWLSLLRGKPILVFAIVSVVGAADEFHQIFLPGRSASLDDLAADIFAALVITTLLEYARRKE